MTTALVLVDVQRDFLDRPGLVPDRATVCGRLGRLLSGCRALGVPVAHVQTVTRPDGSDRMPHWGAAGVVACVAGTPGAAPPPALAPLAGEAVVAKRFFSGFGGGSSDLDEWLRARGVERIVVAGLYLHGCVRATVVDGYERGYEVWVADDAVATTDAVHGAVSRAWLDRRAARFLPVDEVLSRLGGGSPADVGLRTAAAVRTASAAAAEAQRAWGATPVGVRAELLDRVAEGLEAALPRLVAL
ncbi:MAG: alpha-ketoglutaric semialdehyde dehydrogenase, partial [Actinomycetota bacterium]|nr:alpha-ketoglutaric semialdehyde dehydrogenase [Actinomycetota bacterium]